MILNKYSLKCQMHQHFKLETFYIKFQEYLMNFAFFKKLVLKLKNIIYYFTYRLCGIFLTCCFRNLTNFSKKKVFTLSKEENP